MFVEEVFGFERDNVFYRVTKSSRGTNTHNHGKPPLSASSSARKSYHDKSIEATRESAKRQGVADRVKFEVAKAREFPGKEYDFVAVFDCLHDMGDPVGAAAHVRAVLSDDGAWMIVEPFANDDLQDNLNPVGRVYYSFSTLLCTRCSRSQEVGMCLGAQAGEKQIQKVVNSAGFSRFRRATQTPFNPPANF
jgi:hypothetical protein